MKKKCFCTLLAVVALLCSIFMLNACSNNDPLFDKNQITINDIYYSLRRADLPTINGTQAIELSWSYNNNELLNWQRDFEHANIDTSDFMAMDKNTYKFTDAYYYVRVFKFGNLKAAKNCFDNYPFAITCKIKLYGNLVVSVDEPIADFVYNIIDNIKK